MHLKNFHGVMYEKYDLERGIFFRTRVAISGRYHGARKNLRIVCVPAQTDAYASEYAFVVMIRISVILSFFWF